jgi:tyrosine-protein kinase Etk/Wzc
MDDTASPQNDSGQAGDEESVNLADYLRVVSRNRRIIFWICAVIVIVTAVISLILPKKYAATASILPPMEFLQDQAKLTTSLGLGLGKGGLASQLLGMSNIADMYVEILKSQVIADAIINRFDLMKLYHKKYRSEALIKLSDNTIIKGSSEGIVSITVLDRDRNRAAEMANAYVDELDRQNKRLSMGQSTSKRVFLENRLKEIQAELSNIENITSREARIKEMLFELLTKEYEIAKIEEAKSMPTIQILDRAVVPEKKYSPKRIQMIVLAGIAGLFVSILFAFSREYFARNPVNSR